MLKDTNGRGTGAHTISAWTTSAHCRESACPVVPCGLRGMSQAKTEKGEE